MVNGDCDDDIHGDGTQNNNRDDNSIPKDCWDCGDYGNSGIEGDDNKDSDRNGEWWLWR